MAPPKKVKLDLKGINDLIFSARLWLESRTRLQDFDLQRIQEQDKMIKDAADKMVASFSEAQAKKVDAALTGIAKENNSNDTAPADFKKLFGAT